MIYTRNTTVPPKTGTPAGRPGAMGDKNGESFEVDLREALAGTIVRDASFEEFRRALNQYLAHQG